MNQFEVLFKSELMVAAISEPEYSVSHSFTGKIENHGDRIVQHTQYFNVQLFLTLLHALEIIYIVI